jgi:lambda repressor-like predicted transcriptional regulator
MHHEDIKAALRKKGVTPADLARHLKVTDQTMSLVIRRQAKSARIAAAISKLTEIPVEQLWPGYYDASRASAKVQQLLRSLSTGAVAKTRKAA